MQNTAAARSSRRARARKTLYYSRVRGEPERFARIRASLSAFATLRFCDNDGIIVVQRHKRRGQLSLRGVSLGRAVSRSWGAVAATARENDIVREVENDRGDDER